jgi:hypothetical protein
LRGSQGQTVRAHAQLVGIECARGVPANDPCEVRHGRDQSVALHEQRLDGLGQLFPRRRLLLDERNGSRRQTDCQGRSL